MSTDQDTSASEFLAWLRGAHPEAEPANEARPVPWDVNSGGAGAGVMAEGAAQVDREQRPGGDVSEFDAAVRGWSAGPGVPRGEALFLLAGSWMCMDRAADDAPPLWLSMSEVVNLDAIGEPVTPSDAPAMQEVELVMADGRTLHAGWPTEFCDRVVARLQELADRDLGASASRSTAPSPPPAPEAPMTAVPEAPEAPMTAAPEAPSSLPGPDVRFDEVVDHRAPFPAPAAPQMSAASRQAAMPSPHFAAPPTLPAAVAGPVASRPSAPMGTLELEDVVYLGGYPGQARRRKRCTAALGSEGLEVSGPGDLRFRISWSVVRSIQVQNADEARFRMNAKIHRDASALVVECDQDVTILLEARDCPTIALRSAIAQLMASLPVVVV
jgi:hypothetical protein